QLSEGWKAPTFCQLKPTWFTSLPFSNEEQEAWDKEVISLWQMGAIHMLDKQWVQKWGLPIVVMPIFLVKETTKYRPILDARYSNLVFNPKWFALPSIMDFTSLLQKDLYWFKTDQKAGWQHLSLHPLHARLFGFVWQDHLFVYTSPPFGDATAPWIFTYMGNTLKRILRNRKIPNICYIDDFLFPGTAEYTTTAKLRETVLDLEMSLGFVMGAPKCPLPAQEGEALGFFISTTQGIITISSKRIEKILHLLEVFQTTSSVPIKQIAKLVGLIVSCSILHPQTLWFVAPLYPILNQATSPREWRLCSSIPHQAIKRVHSWLNHVRSFPRKLWVSPPTIRWVSSDATLKQVGAAIWNAPPNYLVLSDTNSNPLVQASSQVVCPNPICIAHKEAAAVPWALHIFWPLLPQGATIHWGIDNTVALGTLRKGYSSIPYLQHIVDEFMSKAIKKNLVVLFHYVPSKLNVTSDWLSRLVDHRDDWCFNTFYWNKFIQHCLQHNLPIPAVDCFAAAHNKRCRHFHSRFMDIGSRGDFFSSSLSQQEIHWANPPFSRKAGLISKAFSHFSHQKVQVWFLLPVWTTASWWTWTSKACHSFQISPTPNHPIFAPAIATKQHIPEPSWPICIFYFDFRSPFTSARGYSTNAQQNCNHLC
ncbi:DNA N-6-adenine-methyltransferase, partial [Nitrosomonas sp.]|uniref:DNA N-6-adenine-methyltransferase n=1 Tax=Nitrosomonas sp. TaxID=42353 RepID=UPI0025E16577